MGYKFTKVCSRNTKLISQKLPKTLKFRQIRSHYFHSCIVFEVETVGRLLTKQFTITLMKYF